MAQMPTNHQSDSLGSAGATNALTRFLRRYCSVSVLIESSAVSKGLIICALALLVLAFALVALAKGAVGADFASGAPISGVTMLQSDNQALRFIYHTAKRAQTLAAGSDNKQTNNESFLVAIPFGSTAQIGYVKPFGGATANILLQKLQRVVTTTRGPQALLELGAESDVRGWRVVSLNVSALQNDIVYDSLEIEIQFVPTVSANSVGSKTSRIAQPGVFGAIFAATMLNYTEATVWVNSAIFSAPLYRSAASVNPFSQNNEWYKLNVTTDGLVRVNGSDLAAAGMVIPTSSDRVRVFYNGGEPLPDANPRDTLFARPTLDELPIKLFDGGDGRFDANDYFVFYGESANHWRYAANSAPHFIRNVFTDDNYYWMTASGSFANPAERIAQVAGAPSGTGQAISAARKIIRVEQDKVVSENGRGDIDNYYDWFWSGENTIVAAFIAENPSTNTNYDLTTYYKGHAIARAFALTVNNQSATLVASGQGDFWSLTAGALKNGVNSMRVDQTKLFSRGPYLDYLEVDYLAELSYVTRGLDFYIPDTSGIRDIRITGAPSGAMVWGISDTRQPFEITGGLLQAGSLNFAANLDIAGPNRFYIANVAAAKFPASIKRVVTVDLRSATAAQVDFIIVTPRTWIDNLDSYVAYRSAASNVTINVVAVEDIYNEFSAGRIDPTAIRDYLKYAFENSPSPAPSTVLFVGDGTYDFRNVGPGAATNKIPPYIRSERVERDYISDDTYVYFEAFAFLDSDGNYVADSVLGVDMVPARWPVRTVAELNRVIDKTINYETAPEFGPWRTKVLLLADDEFGADFVNEAVHVTQTEELEKNHLPADMLREKVYLWDFDFNSTRERPGVNDALVRTINEGALVFNYVGHGNLSLFAHERVFTTQSDLPRLTNGKRLPLVFTASCSIGFFDSPTQEGMSEELLRMNNGAICVVSATRLVYSSANAEFNRVAFDHLFGPQNLSIAQALFAAKLTRQGPGGAVDNDRRYSCFGDPFLRLSRPEYKVAFTDTPDSLVALKPTTISGNILDESGSVFTSFNGEAVVTVRDSRSERDHKVLNLQGNVDVDVFYDINGPIIFRGVTPVVSGAFSVGFIPSLDITFGGEGAQISVYASNASTDADGTKDSIPVSAEITSSTDADGPNLTLLFPDREGFLSGDKIGENEEMIVRFEDPSGINLSGAFGHGISFIIDDDQTTQAQLTDSFAYDAGSFSAGELHYTIPSSSPGVHQYKIRVWDNANNSSTLAFAAETSLGESQAISELLNYPNPMNGNESTSFYFNLQAPASLVTLQIFTVAGAEVYVAEASDLLANYHSDMFAWDGRDRTGTRVATGIYLYKVVAFPENGSGAIEEFGKLIVMN